MILSEEWKQTSEAFSTFLSSLDNIRESVKQKQTEFDEHCAALNNKIEETHTRSISSDNHKIVKLNIGGQKFQTSQGTLLSVHESFFWCMLHSGGWKPDDKENEEYFIDRSPTVFPLILESLRQQKPVCTNHLSEFETEVLNNDLDFYGLNQVWRMTTVGGLTPVLVAVQWRSTSKHGGIRLKHHNQTAVFEQGFPFDSNTQVITPPLKTLTTESFQITCTWQHLGADPDSYFFVAITDKNDTGKQAGKSVFVGRSPATFTCVFMPSANTVMLSAGWSTTDICLGGITDPVCVVQYSQTGPLPSVAEFRITAC